MIQIYVEPVSGLEVQVMKRLSSGGTYYFETAAGQQVVMSDLHSHFTDLCDCYTNVRVRLIRKV